MVAAVEEVGHLPDTPRARPRPRFLPAFDNAILGYDDRSRIVDDAHRGLSVAGEHAVLVDGRVSATWTVDACTVRSPRYAASPGPTVRTSRRRAGAGIVSVRGREPPRAGAASPR